MSFTSSFKKFFNSSKKVEVQSRNTRSLSGSVVKTEEPMNNSFSREEPQSLPKPDPKKINPAQATQKTTERITSKINIAADESRQSESDTLVTSAPVEWYSNNGLTKFQDSRTVYELIHALLERANNHITPHEKELLTLQVHATSYSESALRFVEKRIQNLKDELYATQINPQVSHMQDYKDLRALLNDLEKFRKHELDFRIKHLVALYDFFVARDEKEIASQLKQKIVGIHTVSYSFMS